ncbi:hypothetical protein J6590_016967 [Homalodisca vitripennis]|nr:hypothetical protein J6590_016967 [Homalodisca vitripennis]
MGFYSFIVAIPSKVVKIIRVMWTVPAVTLYNDRSVDYICVWTSVHGTVSAEIPARVFVIVLVINVIVITFITTYQEDLP